MSNPEFTFKDNHKKTISNRKNLEAIWMFDNRGMVK